jgi:hypothetical protein
VRYSSGFLCSEESMSIEKNELFIPSLKIFAEHINERKSAECIFDIILSVLTDPETMHFKFVSATSKFRINSPVPEIVDFWECFYDALHKGITLSDFLISVSVKKNALFDRIKEAENSGRLSTLLGELKLDRELEWKGKEHWYYSVGYFLDEEYSSPLNDFANIIIRSALDGGASKIIIGDAPPDNQESVSCPQELDEILKKYHNFEFISFSEQESEPSRPIYFLTSMGWVDAFQIPDSIIHRLINRILILADHLYWDKLDDAISFDIRLENGHFVKYTIHTCTEINRTMSITLQRYVKRFIEVEKYSEEDFKPIHLFGLM